MNTEELHIEHLALEELHLDPANPRRISEAEIEALERSVRQFGLIDPLIARREDHVLIGGHQRATVARRLGLGTVPVILLDVTQEQARLLNRSLNRISGEWDEPLLARLLADLGAIPEVDLSLSGFEERRDREATALA